MSASMEMPQYKCHKIVWALKIAKIQKNDFDLSATITPADEGYGDFKVSTEYMAKNDPQVGGYYVVYEDGYKSFSPAEAFESGYSQLKNRGLNFGQALDALKKGKMVQREGWNGKGMWLTLINPGNAMHSSSAGRFDMQPCIGMKTANDLMQPGWLASQNDMLAEDWLIL